MPATSISPRSPVPIVFGGDIPRIDGPDKWAREDDE